MISGAPVDGEGWVSSLENNWICGVDLLGSLFFLLSRYEEVVRHHRDEHDRFPCSASLLGQEGGLDRPLGNEYLEFLWGLMRRIWPGLKRRSRQFRTRCYPYDIDWPSLYWNCPLTGVIRAAGKLLVRQRNPPAALGILRGRLLAPGSRRRWDPYDNIGWILDQSDHHGLTSTFYYIPSRTDLERDPGMPINHPQVEAQWREIAARGHEIGVHPGYETYQDEGLLCSQVEGVRKQLRSLGIGQEKLGGRQHYLRWKTPETARFLDSAGLDHDSTLGFAEQIGFRCGICYEFPLYDVKCRRKIGLRERPLVVMDCSVMDERYMGLGTGEEARGAIAKLKDRCRQYHGDFTILWHNTRLCREDERSLYLSALTA